MLPDAARRAREYKPSLFALHKAQRMSVRILWKESFQRPMINAGCDRSPGRNPPPGGRARGASVPRVAVEILPGCRGASPLAHANRLRFASVRLRGPLRGQHALRSPSPREFGIVLPRTLVNKAQMAVV